MKRTLYRVMHPVTGTGPWQASNTEEFLTLSEPTKQAMLEMYAYMMALPQYDSPKHPSMHEDFGWINFTRKVCAVTSMKKLREWFHDETVLIYFILCGLTVYKITIDDEFVTNGYSGMQVAFDKDADFTMEDIGLGILLDNA